MRGKRGGAPALLATVGVALVAAGCGSQSQDPPSNADVGDPAANKALRAEAVRAWLDPEGLEEYENTAVAVVHNTSDKIATGVTAEFKFPNGYSTSQDQAIDIQPGGSGVFVISNFDAPKDVKGQPKAELKADGLVAPKHDGSPVKLKVSKSAVNKALRSGSCSLEGTATNDFKRNHPGVSGMVAGLKDGKLVTVGSIFFAEPGLVPGKEAFYKASLEPLCKKGDSVDEVVSFVSLSEADLQDP